MGQTRSRSISFTISIVFLIANALSSLLSYKLPDDPYHLASNFGWYLYFANAMSILGFVGALRQNASCMTIFANFLILDTILFSIPRFLALGVLSELSSAICGPNSHYNTTSAASKYLSLPADSATTATNLLGLEAQFSDLTDSWEPAKCVQIVGLLQLTLIAGAAATTLLQVVGALYVREYAKVLWRREANQGVVVWVDVAGSDEEKQMAGDR